MTKIIVALLLTAVGLGIIVYIITSIILFK